jgi:hypothetical protein
VLPFGLYVYVCTSYSFFFSPVLLPPVSCFLSLLLCFTSPLRMIMQNEVMFDVEHEFSAARFLLQGHTSWMTLLFNIGAYSPSTSRWLESHRIICTSVNSSAHLVPCHLPPNLLPVPLLASAGLDCSPGRRMQNLFAWWGCSSNSSKLRYTSTKMNWQIYDQMSSLNTQSLSTLLYWRIYASRWRKTSGPRRRGCGEV